MRNAADVARALATLALILVGGGICMYLWDFVGHDLFEPEPYRFEIRGREMPR